MKNNYMIKTSTGFKDFSGIVKKTKNELYKFVFYDGSFIECSAGHGLLTQDGFKKARDVKITDSLSDKKILNISSKQGVFEVYDPVDVAEHNSYLSNGIISHNTEFLGSSNTLINSTVLSRMTYKDPIYESDDTYFKSYYHVKPDGSYCMTVDVAEGVGGDYLTFTVFDISEMPYKVCCTYRNNLLDPLLFPSVIYGIAREYNDAYVLIESNGIGKQVANQLFYDLEYENVISSLFRKDTVVDSSQKAELGVKTTKSTKRIGVATLKSLIEKDQIETNDYQIFYELSRFVQKGTSFQAEEGETDDMVMNLVTFSWLTCQNYFTELTNIDTRRNIRQRAYQEIQNQTNIFVPSRIEHKSMRINNVDIDVSDMMSMEQFDDWLLS